MNRCLKIMLAVQLAAALVASAAPSGIVCEGEYPYHMQGVATDGTNLYWTFTTVLVRTDLDGKVLSRYEITRSGGHMGDLCCRDGRVFVSMNHAYRDGCRVGDEVWEFDGRTLELARRHPTPQMIWCNNGLEWYGGYFWLVANVPHHSRYNYVFQFTPDFRFKCCRPIDSGWTNIGVQTVCLHGDKMLFGYYGGGEKGSEFQHSPGIFVVDAKALTSGRRHQESPEILPCERRVPVNAADGLVSLNGRLMAARDRNLSQDPSHQRWTAALVPIELK